MKTAVYQVSFRKVVENQEKNCYKIGYLLCYESPD